MRPQSEPEYVRRMAGELWETRHVVRAASWLHNPEHAQLLRAYRYAATEFGAGKSILADVTPEVACLIWKIMQTSLAVTAVMPRTEESPR